MTDKNSKKVQDTLSKTLAALPITGMSEGWHRMFALDLETRIAAKHKDSTGAEYKKCFKNMTNLLRGRGVISVQQLADGIFRGNISPERVLDTVEVDSGSNSSPAAPVKQVAPVAIKSEGTAATKPPTTAKTPTTATTAAAAPQRIVAPVATTSTHTTNTPLPINTPTPISKEQVQAHKIAAQVTTDDLAKKGGLKNSNYYFFSTTQSTSAGNSYAPQKIIPTQADTNGTTSLSGGLSKWNSSGTSWEETDLSGWARNTLTQTLKGWSCTCACGDQKLLVKLKTKTKTKTQKTKTDKESSKQGEAKEEKEEEESEELDEGAVKVVGDANVVFTRGKKRAGFELQIDVKVSIINAETHASLGECAVSVPSFDDMDDDVDIDTTFIHDKLEPRVKSTLRGAIEGSTNKAMEAFRADFHAYHTQG